MNRLVSVRALLLFLLTTGLIFGINSLQAVVSATPSNGDNPSVARDMEDQVSPSGPKHIFKSSPSNINRAMQQKPEYLHADNYQSDSLDNPTLAAKKDRENPASFKLKQNYPNPFNPATEITYKLPVSRHVTLKVYDMLGRPIKTLVDANQEEGNYTVRFNAGGLTSGMYLYRLKAGDYEQIRKMILIK